MAGVGLRLRTAEPVTDREGAALMALRGRGSAFEPDEAQQIVGEVGQPELGRGTGQPDRADDQAQALLLAAKTCSTAARTLPRVALPRRTLRRHRLAAGLGPLQPGGQAPLGERGQIGGRAIGGVGPDPARRVAGVEQIARAARRHAPRRG